MSLLSATLPAATAVSELRDAWLSGHENVRENGIVPIIITIAIIVLLALAASVVTAAIILCAQNHAVLDTVVSLNTWTVKIQCHKI